MFELPHFYEHFLRACQEYDPAYDGSIIAMSALRGKLDFIGPLAIVANELFFSGRIVEEAARSQ